MRMNVGFKSPSQSWPLWGVNIGHCFWLFQVLSISRTVVEWMTHMRMDAGLSPPLWTIMRSRYWPCPVSQWCKRGSHKGHWAAITVQDRSIIPHRHIGEMGPGGMCCVKPLRTLWKWKWSKMFLLSSQCISWSSELLFPAVRCSRCIAVLLLFLPLLLLLLRLALSSCSYFQSEHLFIHLKPIQTA